MKAAGFMILGRCEWQRCMGSLGRKLQNRTEGGGEGGGTMGVRTGEIRKAGGPEKCRWLVEVREDGEWIGGRAELGWL